jgi:methylase of polypeptide subunit release factors
MDPLAGRAPSPESARWGGRSFLLGPRTFRPRESSLPLIGLAVRASSRLAGPPLPLIDLCCGCGALGISLFLASPGRFRSLLSLDASEEAVAACALNLERHGVPGEARVWEAGEPLDVPGPAFVICNPPFLAAESAAGPRTWEWPCLYSGGQGIAVAALCMESLAGAPATVALKSAPGHVAVLEQRCRGSHRPIEVAVAPESGIAFSLWQPAAPAARKALS